jgi:O-antigen/teichoic acid export membrane protein
LQALDRPDLTAKIHLSQVVPYAAVLWWFIPRWGISGAAMAWTLRAALDFGLLFAACVWARYVDGKTLIDRRLLRGAGLVLALGIVLDLTRLGHGHWIGQIILAAVLLALFTVGVWLLTLDETDKGFVTNGIGTLVGALTKVSSVR